MFPFFDTKSPAGHAVHLINPMINPNGGSENRTISLYRIISQKARTKIWSDRKFSRELAEIVPISRITPLLSYPRSGTFVFVGAYFKIDRWILRSDPSRIVVIYNTPEPENLNRFMATMDTFGLAGRVEIVYAANWMKERAGFAGVVHASPIDLDRFQARSSKGERAEFVVGRLSRDVPEKHHPDDVHLWRRLAELGTRVRLMGATCVAHQLNGFQNIEVLPAGAEDPVKFLQSLDAFVFRTDPSWFEPYGRVAFEAMACGVPILCGRDGGYREYIDSGENGFLFDGNDEAIRILSDLRDDVALANRIARMGRRTVERLFSDEELNGQAEFYSSPRRKFLSAC